MCSATTARATGWTTCWILLALLIAIAPGCRDRMQQRADGAVEPAVQLAENPVDELEPAISNQLNAIVQRMELSQAVTEADFKALEGLARRYSRAKPVSDAMLRGFALRGDWNGLLAYARKLPERNLDPRLVISASIQACRYEEALIMLQSTADSATGEEIGENLWLQAFCNYHLGKLDDAEKLLQVPSVRESEQRQVDILAMRGLIAIQNDRLAEAQDFFENALKVDPDHTISLSNLARILAETGASGRAAELEARSAKVRNASIGRDISAKRRAALVRALEDAWDRQDYERSRELVNQLMPDSTSTEQANLQKYLDEIAIKLGETPGETRPARN